ncbi:MAG: hypothetical protein KatS3mg087_0054 [Patescibacteria group bacterium]|nr:MAG: hypothetical protein KatS3mg087_0054 [Patescibacteria group bacterium]
MCREAHGELFPNDVIFEFIYKLLLLISEQTPVDDLSKLRDVLVNEIHYQSAEKHDEGKG